MVIWITGLSGVGKTTVSEALAGLVKPRLPELVLIDGDIVRAMFGANLGYAEEERVVQIKRLQNLALMMSRQNMVAVVAALYSHPNLLNWNRETFADYFEVLLDAPVEFVQGRDTKGLYANAAKKKAPQVVGLDIPWHRPESADLVIDATLTEAPEIQARRIAMSVPRLTNVLPVGSDA